MKAIEINLKKKILIKYEKIKNFTNICKVTGVKEKINIEIEYIPNKKVIEIGSYRKYFYTTKFNEYIENIPIKIFDKIYKLIKPRYLKVTIFLIDKKLTPWSVTVQKGKKKI